MADEPTVEDEGCLARESEEHALASAGDALAAAKGALSAVAARTASAAVGVALRATGTGQTNDFLTAQAITADAARRTCMVLAGLDQLLADLAELNARGATMLAAFSANEAQAESIARVVAATRKRTGKVADLVKVCAREAADLARILAEQGDSALLEQVPASVRRASRPGQARSGRGRRARR